MVTRRVRGRAAALADPPVRCGCVAAGCSARSTRSGRGAPKPETGGKDEREHGEDRGRCAEPERDGWGASLVPE